MQFDILDINMGCPAPKITSSGAGSKLMQDPELCGRMAVSYTHLDVYKRQVTTHSYRGRWFSNSRLHMEWVIPSMAS